MMKDTEIQRINGLDTIRAICAFWVVMHHCGGPPLGVSIDTTTSLGRKLYYLPDHFWNGPAAVIVFFVISGFCIHYPYAKKLQIPSLASYAVRRYIRIGIPLFAAIGISKLLNCDLGLFKLGILWSIIAEIIYYTLYPLLLWFRRKGFSWSLMIALGFIFAFALASTRPEERHYAFFGFKTNWILGLPCWLGGCWLAERASLNQLSKTNSIWLWRALIIAVIMALSIICNSTPIGYPWTLNIFSLLALAWLAREISWFAAYPPPWILEFAGKWSYSLYLIHMISFAVFKSASLPNLGSFTNWTMLTTFILITSYLFYLAVELPSHRLAKKMGKLVNSYNMNDRVVVKDNT